MTMNLFIDSLTSQIKKIGMNEMRVNNNEMSIKWNNEAWSIPEK